MIFALIVIAALLALALLFFGVPWLMLAAARHASRAHRPLEGELWTQDSATLSYIDYVDAAGRARRID